MAVDGSRFRRSLRLLRASHGAHGSVPTPECGSPRRRATARTGYPRVGAFAPPRGHSRWVNSCDAGSRMVRYGIVWSRSRRCQKRWPIAEWITKNSIKTDEYISHVAYSYQRLPGSSPERPTRKSRTNCGDLSARTKGSVSTPCHHGAVTRPGRISPLNERRKRQTRAAVSAASP